MKLRSQYSIRFLVQEVCFKHVGIVWSTSRHHFPGGTFKYQRISSWRGPELDLQLQQCIEAFNYQGFPHDQEISRRHYWWLISSMTARLALIILNWTQIKQANFPRTPKPISPRPRCDFVIWLDVISHAHLNLPKVGVLPSNNWCRMSFVQTQLKKLINGSKQMSKVRFS